MLQASLTRRDLALLAGSAFVSPRSRAAAGTAWRLATGYRSESFQTVNLMTMAREVEQATHGELRISVHPNGELGKLGEIRGLVQGGLVDAGETIMSSLAGEMPIAGADSVPFITNSYDDARRMWTLQRPLVEKQFTEHGLQVLYAVPWPPQGLYANKPIAGIGDLRGSHMRSYNATTARIATLVGAEPVDVPMVEVGRALAEGRIESMITSAVTGVENRVWSFVRYYYDINAWFPKNIVFANAKAMQTLSASARQAVLAAAADAETRGWAASVSAAASSVDELRRNGMKVERVSREFSLDIRRLGERFSLEWVRQVGRDANDVFIPYFNPQR